jgi:tryptophan-rich sensory protein
MNSLILAILIAAAAAGLEAVLSGRRPFAFLASLDQPRWALPNAGWMAVGAGFYIIMTYALWRTLEAGDAGRLATSLIVLVLLTDGFWNFLLFRSRRLDWAYWYLFPYAALVAVATAVALTIDPPAAGAMLLYVIFLPYDFAWTRALMHRNPRYAAAGS